MKNYIKLSIFLLFTIALHTAAYADTIADPTLNYTVTETNSKALMIDGTFIPQAVIITEKDRTLVPARIVSENLGAQVLWDGNTRNVTVSKDGIQIIMKENDTTAYLNGSAITLEAPVKIYDGSTYVPLRFIAESLGGKAGYTLIQPKSEMTDLLSLPIVWIDSKEFSAQHKISDSDALKEIKAAVTADIDKNYYSFAVKALSEGKLPGHFDIDYVFQLLKNYTANTDIQREFSCYALAGYSFEDCNILFNKITNEIYVLNIGSFKVKIAEYNVADYLYSLHLD